MREDTLRTLEVFKYASSLPSDSDNWHKTDIARLEAQLIKDQSLGRLSALILQTAVVNEQFGWFSSNTQALLKNTTTQLVVDVTAKQHFIKQLVPLLDLHNIPVILLKGMAFNHYLYDNSAPRGVSDIDILIKPGHKEQFKFVFNELATLVELEKKYAFDDLYEQTWRSKNNQHLIDVHTHLTNPHLFDINISQLWLRSKPHPAYATENVRVLGAEDTICHLVTHMINDTNFYHYNLIDMKMLISSEDLDEALLAEIAKKWGVINATQFVLQVTHEYLGNLLITLKIHKNFVLAIRSKLAILIIKQLFTLASDEKSLLHRLKQLCCYTLVLDKGTVIFKISLLYLLGLVKKLRL